MTNEESVNIKELVTLKLKEFEGLRLKAYTDSTGHVTIGFGRNLSDNGITLRMAYSMLDEDISYHLDKLSDLDWFNSLNESRKVAIVTMSYNLGLQSLLSFNKMIGFIKKKKYLSASKEIMNSQWANQVGNRAQETAHMMKTGVISV